MSQKPHHPNLMDQSVPASTVKIVLRSLESSSHVLGSLQKQESTLPTISSQLEHLQRLLECQQELLRLSLTSGSNSTLLSLTGMSELPPSSKQPEKSTTPSVTESTGSTESPNTASKTSSPGSLNRPSPRSLIEGCEYCIDDIQRFTFLCNDTIRWPDNFQHSLEMNRFELSSKLRELLSHTRILSSSVEKLLSQMTPGEQ